MLEKWTYTNERSQSAEISHFSPFFLVSVEGADAIKNIVYTQKSPNQDGVSKTGDSLEPRDIMIKGSINKTKKDEILKQRQKLLQIFNPKLEGKLRYQTGEFAKEIDCTVEHGPVFPTVPSLFKKFMILLYCPNPYWRDIASVTEEIVTWIGGMTFPLKLPTAFATKGPKIINIRNDGDVETPIKVEFHGPATNPRIENKTTGEFVKVNQVLTPEDILVITTEFGNKRVEINGENAFNWIDLDSVFWQLQPGDNVIEYTSDDEVEDATVKVIYKNRYLGV